MYTRVFFSIVFFFFLQFDEVYCYIDIAGHLVQNNPTLRLGGLIIDENIVLNMVLGPLLTHISLPDIFLTDKFDFIQIA